MITRTSPRMLCAVSATLVLVLAGCGGDDDDADTTLPGAPPGAELSPSEPVDPYAPAAADEILGSIDVADQAGDGTALTVASVNIESSPGWIALHADADGAPGPVVGFVQIPEGDSENVDVMGEDALSSGDYWPMLHRDDGELGTYEFGETQGAQDAPVTRDGKPVMKQVTYTVE